MSEIKMLLNFFVLCVGAMASAKTARSWMNATDLSQDDSVSEFVTKTDGI